MSTLRLDDREPLAAVFFDFDGVLAESLDIKIRAFIALYEEYGPEILERVLAHHRAQGGVSRIQKIRYCHREMLGIQLQPEELMALGRRFSSLVVDAVVDSVWVEGARELLDGLVGRLPLFVVSGTPEPELHDIVSRRGMDDYFVSVRGSPPDKITVIRELLDAHDLPAERVLFVGDAMTDHDAAQATGLRFIGRVAPGEENPFPAATAIVPDLTALSI
ncbi:MAG TPA: HAD hydrolase-like protein [Rhodospirillales bacterium]|nr:HAD hydrolase-like protein [Rhodospirillales bacterium]